MIREAILSGIILTSSLALNAFAADEAKISLADAPATVQAAAKKLAGEAKITDVSKEIEDGKTVFETEFTVNGVEHSASFAEDGKLLEDEAEVEVADLPKAVSETIAKELPGGKLKEASKVSADGKIFYEVEVKVGDEKHEVKVSTEGKLMSNKVEKKEKDEKDEK